MTIINQCCQCCRMSEDGTVFITTTRKFNEDTQQATWRIAIRASLDVTVDGKFENEIYRMPNGDIVFTSDHIKDLDYNAHEHASEIQMLARLNFNDIMEKLAKEER